MEDARGIPPNERVRRTHHSRSQSVPTAGGTTLPRSHGRHVLRRRSRRLRVFHRGRGFRRGFRRGRERRPRQVFARAGRSQAGMGSVRNGATVARGVRIVHRLVDGRRHAGYFLPGGSVRVVGGSDDHDDRGRERWATRFALRGGDCEVFQYHDDAGDVSSGGGPGRELEVQVTHRTVLRKGKGEGARAGGSSHLMLRDRDRDARRDAQVSVGAGGRISDEQRQGSVVPVAHDDGSMDDELPLLQGKIRLRSQYKNVAVGDRSGANRGKAVRE
mmetsp:Transcript_37505/g.80946  ORF Transcript_37505/g.80946 Transcript_37505/m.80946 type:complete len:273 (-) Transcript_37505:695-1513(-)